MTRVSIVQSYCLFVGGWFLVYLLWPDQWWPFVLLNKLAVFFLLAAVPALFLALSTFSATAIFSACIPIAIGLYFYHPSLTPGMQQDRQSRDLRVLTYNIWNQNQSLESAITVLLEIDADVVALQEVLEEVKDPLIEGLQSNYPYYHVSKPVYGGTTALFSKYRLNSILELDFKIDRPAIIADISIENDSLTVVSGHLNPSYYAYHDRPIAEMPGAIERYIVDQRKQVVTLMETLQKRDAQNVVFACDCNTQATASTHALLRQYFIDSVDAVGWQIGHPPGEVEAFERNFSRIDYVWFKGALIPVGVYRSRKSGGSDHRPVFSDFTL